MTHLELFSVSKKKKILWNDASAQVTVVYLMEIASLYNEI